LRAALAASAQTESQISASTMNTTPSSNSWSGIEPAVKSTNWGSTATKKAIVLGFVTPTMKPSPSWRQCERVATWPFTAAAASARCRIAWMPR
jgi:hypothetical protein